MSISRDICVLIYKGVNFYERAKTFATTFLQGLGHLSAANGCSHCAPDGRATRDTPFAAPLVGVGMIMTHVVANRTWCFHEKMGEGPADIADYTLWDNAVCEENFNPNHSAATLVTGLERTWQMIYHTLARLTPADLEESIPMRNWLGEERPPRTRQWLIWGTLEHDIYHGGEISVHARHKRFARPGIGLI